MKRASLFGGMIAVGLLVSTPHAQQQPSLVQASDLRYEGAFRVPLGGSGGSSFMNGGDALAYYPAHNTLFAAGHPIEWLVAEMMIPTPSKGSFSSLPIAGFAHNFADTLEGKRNQILSSSPDNRIGGMLVSGSSLITSAFVFYDANQAQTLSHFSSSATFATGSVKGPYQVGTAGAGMVSGYMAAVSLEWQTALGGNALTGQCCIPITGRTSSGPSASVFNTADVGTRSPVPATQVLGYPLANQPDSTIWTNADTMGGMVMPPGTRSVLFFGRHSPGPICYGIGGSGGQCNDPTNSDKGYHGYPYVYQVWAYDVLDLIAVKNGQRQPHTLRPYATWTWDVPLNDASRYVRGVAFDPATARLYISANSGAETDQRPLIHVFTILSGSQNAAPPAAPTGVHVAQ